jgi:hypothetical protein
VGGGENAITAPHILDVGARWILAGSFTPRLYQTEEELNRKLDGSQGQCGLLKVKVKITQEEATKAQRGSRGIALLFL